MSVAIRIDQWDDCWVMLMVGHRLLCDPQPCTVHIEMAPAGMEFRLEHPPMQVYSAISHFGQAEVVVERDQRVLLTAPLAIAVTPDMTVGAG